MSGSRSSVAIAAILAALTIAHATPARAQNEGGAAAAESLFQEGRRLMDAKRYSEACPKLVASHKLAPGVGTLLNLADCYEKDGKLASAWARFHEAIALAQRLGRRDREQTAKERADKIEPRLIKLSIVAKDSNLDVKLDGNALDSAALGSPVPVDPGKHLVEASAKGKKPFSATIDVSDRSRSPSIEIPALEAEPEAKKDPVVTPPVEDKPADESGNDGRTQRIIGVVGVGVGVAGVVVGSIFGLKTSSTWDEAKTHCTGLECDRTGVELATDAKNSGTISTIGFIAGGALIAGGLVLFFTAPHGSSGSPKTGARADSHGHTGGATARPGTARVGVGPGSIVVGGTF